MTKFYLGNVLRGFFAGEFDSIDEAWSILSNRFLLSFPSNSGRYVSMYVFEKNKYDVESWTKCKYDVTEINDLERSFVLEKCQSFYPM